MAMFDFHRFRLKFIDFYVHCVGAVYFYSKYFYLTIYLEMVHCYRYNFRCSCHVYDNVNFWIIFG